MSGSVSTVIHALFLKDKKEYGFPQSFFGKGRIRKMSEIQLFQPLPYIEAGTELVHVAQVAVAQYGGVGIVEQEAAHEYGHGALLSFCAGVGRTALSVESALVADADTVLVEVAGVGTRLALGAAGMADAVTGDVVVVTDGLEAAGLVAGLQVFLGERPVAARGAAVNDD